MYRGKKASRERADDAQQSDNSRQPHHSLPSTPSTPNPTPTQLASRTPEQNISSGSLSLPALLLLSLFAYSSAVATDDVVAVIVSVMVELTTDRFDDADASRSRTRFVLSRWLWLWLRRWWLWRSLIIHSASEERSDADALARALWRSSVLASVVVAFVVVEALLLLLGFGVMSPVLVVLPPLLFRHFSSRLCSVEPLVLASVLKAAERCSIDSPLGLVTAGAADDSGIAAGKAGTGVWSCVLVFWLRLLLPRPDRAARILDRCDAKPALVRSGVTCPAARTASRNEGSVSALVLDPAWAEEDEDGTECWSCEDTDGPRFDERRDSEAWSSRAPRELGVGVMGRRGAFWSSSWPFGSHGGRREGEIMFDLALDLCSRETLRGMGVTSGDGGLPGRDCGSGRNERRRRRGSGALMLRFARWFDFFFLPSPSLALLMAFLPSVLLPETDMPLSCRTQLLSLSFSPSFNFPRSISTSTSQARTIVLSGLLEQRLLPRLDRLAVLPFVLLQAYRPPLTAGLVRGRVPRGRWRAARC